MKHTTNTNQTRRGNGRTQQIIKMMLLGAPMVLAALGAAPAQAAPQDYCPYHAACVWDDPSYNTNGNYGSLLGFNQYVTPMSNYVYAGSTVNAGNTADSWYNNGATSTACFYDQASYVGAYQCLNHGYGDGNIENSSGLIQGITWDPNSARFI